jgi:ABC-type antimicrobial peptide transport system permease subunit
MKDKHDLRRDALSRQGQEAVRAYVRGSLGLVAIIAVIVVLVLGFVAIAAAIIHGVRPK